MRNNLKMLFNRKKVSKILAYALGLSVSTTAIILPVVYYSTADKLLYIDSLNRAVTPYAETKLTHEYKGEFTPGEQYKAGDVISVKEVRFENPDLISQFERTYNQIMYTFTKDWSGNSLNNDTPIVRYEPNFTTSTSINLSEFVTDSNTVNSFMGNSSLIKGIGKTSVTGKFNGTGIAYRPYDKPGYATVNQNEQTITLSELDAFFTWTQLWGTDFDNVRYDPLRTRNAYPELGDSAEELKSDRYAYDTAGLCAIQLSNEIIDNEVQIVDQWYSSINSNSYTTFAEPGITGMNDRFTPDYVRLSNDSGDKVFYLDDSNLGLYYYTKTSNYPFTVNASKDNVLNSSWQGYYAGTSEPLYTLEDGTTRYLNNSSELSKEIEIKYPSQDGIPFTITKRIGFQSAFGAYIYSRTSLGGSVNNEWLGYNSKFSSDVYNPYRDISYINGFFSLNKPSTELAAGEQQEIRWYTPIASTDFSYTVNSAKLEEFKGKLLASEVINLGYLSQLFKPYLYNAIPSTFYGAKLNVWADNTTGTVWINVKSGPTAEVSNGSLYENPQTQGNFFKKPPWLLGQSWAYYNGSYPSSYWFYNTNNPVSEIMVGEPIDYTIAINGFTKILPTKIVDTTSSKNDMFIPGVSTADDNSYGPYRLTGKYSKITPFEYMKQEELKNPNERYKDLLDLIFDNLIYNLPTITSPDGTPFITRDDLFKSSDATTFNFINQKHPEWGGRIQLSVSLKRYFDQDGLYVSGGFESVPVVFGGFKAIPGPTTINTNYNLNSMIPGGAVSFNKENLAVPTGVAYPSDYLNEKLAPADGTIYTYLENLIWKWSNVDPFVSDSELNGRFLPDQYMIMNLPPLDVNDTKPFTIREGSVEFNNFAGTLKITPTFSRYYNSSGDLIEGVNTTLGTITISGFQTVDGSTYIPPVVQALSTELQPSALVSGASNIDQLGNYIGTELYKIAWNETINLPTKNYDLPPYTANDVLTPEQINDIKRVIDIRVLPDDPTWVNNKQGYLKFAIAFKRMFNKDGIPEQISEKNLWPTDWQTDKEGDNVFIVTTYGYSNSPGPTSILQQDGANRNIVINQPNFQPSEFIKNDAIAGYPVLRSLIQGNLVNLPKGFTSQDIVLSVDDFNNETSLSWSPTIEPLVPDNKAGKITVQVYLKSWYNQNSKLCNINEDNQRLPYTNEGLNPSHGPAWTFEISGFMKTDATGESDLRITDVDYSQQIPGNLSEINLAKPEVYNFFNANYPEIAMLKNYLPYQFATPANLRDLLLTKNRSLSNKTQPYLLMANIPKNIRPYNMYIKKEDIIVNNIEGSVSFKLTLKQWYTRTPTGDIVYHPTIEDQSQGNLEYTTKNTLTIKGLKNIKNATIISPAGDNVNNDGTIKITKGSTSEEIINGILLEKYINADPENINKLDQYIPFVASESQPIVLDETDLKVYVYVALYKSGGSPYTLEKGSMVELTDVGSYHINDLDALNEFITWKVNPNYDLTNGTVQLSPMLNIWFGGNDAQIFNQYQSFGAGDLGKPIVANGSVVSPAQVSFVKLSGFIKADSSLSFNNSFVYNNEAIVQYLEDQNNLAIELSKFTAAEFTKNQFFVSAIQNIQISNGGIVSVVNDPSLGPNFTMNDIIDFTSNDWYKVNELNGTLELKTKVLKYFDGNKELKVGRISIIISGFKPSVSAYQTTYIILIITIVALILVLAVVLSRILWVKYNKSRKMED